MSLVALIALSATLTLATLVMPASVDEPEGLDSVWFGYPVAFVVQDLRRYTPPQSVFPISFHFDSPLGSPTRWKPIRFAVSVAIVFVVVSVGSYLLRGLWRKHS